MLPIMTNIYDKNFVSRSRLGSEYAKIIQDLLRPAENFLDPDPPFQVIPDQDPTQKTKLEPKVTEKFQAYYIELHQYVLCIFQIF